MTNNFASFCFCFYLLVLVTSFVFDYLYWNTILLIHIMDSLEIEEGGGNREPKIGENVDDDSSSPLVKGMDMDSWNGIDVMSSMCMRCEGEGETRFMLHKIPYFRELVLASFICPECGERNNEVTFGGQIQRQGCVFRLQVLTNQDLDRQIIKSDSACVRIEELDFEIPAQVFMLSDIQVL